MKKKLLIMVLFILLLLGISTISYGAISATSKTVNSGENVTISVSSSELLGAYAIQVTNDGGLTFVSSTPGAGAAANGTTISGASTNGVTSLGSFTFKVPSVSKDTTYYVKISSTLAEGPQPTYADIPLSTATATITVKAPVQKPSPTPTPAPTFQSVNQTVYATTEVNVRSSYSTSSSRIGSLQKGQSVTRTGIGNNGWSKVTFNGQTGYINSQYLTTTKPEENPTTEPSTQPSTPPEETTNDAKLKSLSIVGVELTPEFNPDITSYSANIGEEITEVEVVAEVNNEKTKYEIAGNTELQDGENTVTITVTAEDGTVTTYEIKLLKNLVPAPIEDDTNNTPKTTNKTETKINYKLILIIGAVSLITIIGITFAILYYRKQNDMEYARPDYSFLREDDEKPKNTLEQIYDEKNNGKNDDDNGNFRRGGRHF